jgi:hypothetical protein
LESGVESKFGDYLHCEPPVKGQGCPLLILPCGPELKCQGGIAGKYGVVTS